MSRYPNLRPQLNPPPRMPGPGPVRPSPPPRQDRGASPWLRAFVFVLGITAIAVGLVMFYDQIDCCPRLGMRGPDDRTLKLAGFGVAVVGVVGLTKLILCGAREQ